MAGGESGSYVGHGLEQLRGAHGIAHDLGRVYVGHCETASHEIGGLGKCFVEHGKGRSEGLTGKPGVASPSCGEISEEQFQY